MLKHWKQDNGSAATYQALFDALKHKLVQRQDLAEQFCCIQGDYFNFSWWRGLPYKRDKDAQLMLLRGVIFLAIIYLFGVSHEEIETLSYCFGCLN